jgi:ketosteroid isomerase-like protein
MEVIMNRAAKASTNVPAEATPVEQIYFAWDDALSRNDKDALLALYTPDAVIESPLIPHVLKLERGVVHGRAEIQRLLDEVAARKPPARRFHRTGYLTDGKRLIWEYPRETPDGDQMDFVEAMELNDQGLIQRHRVYWGWYGVRVIQRDEYHR